MDSDTYFILSELAVLCLGYPLQNVNDMAALMCCTALLASVHEDFSHQSKDILSM